MPAFVLDSPFDEVATKQLRKSKGFDRDELPQIQSADVEKFIAFLRRKGVKVTAGEAPVADLKPTQSELNKDKIKKFTQGGLTDKLRSAIIVSSDDYILDGHHRWAAVKELDAKAAIRTKRVDVPIKELIRLGHEFPKSFTKEIHEAIALTVKRGSVTGRHPEARYSAGAITLTPKFDLLARDAQRHVLFHEVGHWFRDQHVPLAEIMGWSPGEGFLIYGQPNSEEGFAEAFASYFTDPSHFKRAWPVQHAQMQARVRGREVEIRAWVARTLAEEIHESERAVTQGEIDEDRLDEEVQQLRKYLGIGRYQVLDLGTVGLFRVYSVLDYPADDQSMIPVRNLRRIQRTDWAIKHLGKVHTLRDYQKNREAGADEVVFLTDPAVENWSWVRGNIQEASDAITSLGVPRQRDTIILRNLSGEKNRITGGGVGGYAYRRTHAIELDTNSMIAGGTDAPELLVHEWGHKQFFNLPQHVTSYVRDWFRINLLDNPALDAATREVEPADRDALVTRAWGGFKDAWEARQGLGPEEFVEQARRVQKEGLSPSETGRMLDYATRGANVMMAYGHLTKGLRNPEGGRGLRKGDTVGVLSARADGPDNFKIIGEKAPRVFLDVNRATVLDSFELDRELTLKNNPKFDYDQAQYASTAIANVDLVKRLTNEALIYDALDGAASGLYERLRAKGYVGYESTLSALPIVAYSKFVQAWTDRVQAEKYDFDAKKAFRDIFPTLVQWNVGAVEADPVRREYRLTTPEGQRVRELAKKIGVTPSSYGAANVDELWAELIAYTARNPGQVPKPLKNLLRDAMQGKTPAPGPRVRVDRTPDKFKRVANESEPDNPLGFRFPPDVDRPRVEKALDALQFEATNLDIRAAMKRGWTRLGEIHLGEPRRRSSYYLGDLWRNGDELRILRVQYGRAEAQSRRLLKGEVQRAGVTSLSSTRDDRLWTLKESLVLDLPCLDEAAGTVTKPQLDALERQLDNLFRAAEIDIEFTRHFLDRVNDPRNGRPITIDELQRIYRAVWDQHRPVLDKADVDWRVVIRDLPTQINIPVVLDYDTRTGRVELVAKTIMRTARFMAREPQLVVRSEAMVDESDWVTPSGFTILRIPRSRRTRARVQDLLGDRGVFAKGQPAGGSIFDNFDIVIAPSDLVQQLRDAGATVARGSVDVTHYWGDTAATMAAARTNLTRLGFRFVASESTMPMSLTSWLDEGVDDPHVLKAVFLAGGGGSGKSFIGGKTFGDTGLRVVNSDPYFEHLMRKAGLDLKKDVGSEAAQALRPRAKAMAQAKEKQLAAGRVGLIIDGTGDNPEKIKKKKAELEALGYDTSMMFVEVPIEVALARNAKRARVVPEAVLRAAHNESQAAKALYQKMFGERYVAVENAKALTPEEIARDLTPKLARIAMKLVDGPVKNPVGRKWVKEQLGPGERGHRALGKERSDTVSNEKPDVDQPESLIRWRTTKRGQKIGFNKKGQAVMGNAHVLAALRRKREAVEERAVALSASHELTNIHGDHIPPGRYTVHRMADNDNALRLKSPGGKGYLVRAGDLEAEQKHGARTAGQWRTTPSGRHIYIERGKVTKGNPHVLAAMRESVVFLDRQVFTL